MVVLAARQWCREGGAKRWRPWKDERDRFAENEGKNGIFMEGV